MMKGCSECIHVKVCGLKHAISVALGGYGIEASPAEICPEYLTTVEKPKETTKKAPVRRKK